MIDLEHAHPLDDPVGSSLRGAHRRFAQQRGRILRYRPDVARFIAYPAHPDARDWHDLAELVGPGVEFTLRNYTDDPPDPVHLLRRFEVVQMTGEDIRDADADADAAGVEVLDDADVPQMLDLVERTRPGPFFASTIDMGTYLGIRHDGRLVAMAGERMHPAGWTEISAVCVEAGFRNRGLATTLVGAVAEIICTRGDVPFLHASSINHNAIALYESIGFRHRARPVLSVMRFGDPT
ncbi:GNAT family N-acetyltransferase [Williamsia soli]|uniref:GNAT family N-acetyltransferase n=1 Tax=Williamsia soli TaxID=364929 RepID=UPI001A9E6758|nr:GNAT family N-acetyltransferase [Williamsia soli]